MEPTKPSATALTTAMHRAAHQSLDSGRIFEDPLAVPILGKQGATIAHQLGNAPGMYGWRIFFCARAHYAEVCLRAAVERGTTQLVVIGAGLDTFAYRNPFEGRLRVFEVDHPATQVWKHEQLRAADIAIPESVTFVPLDLESGDLFGALQSCGFRGDQRAFFICLGVLYYLRKSIAVNILEEVAGHLGAGIVFDYSDPPDTLSATERECLFRIQLQLTASGEPFVSYFDSTELVPTLQSMGFKTIEDLDPESWIMRYEGPEMLGAWRAGSANAGRGAHILSAFL